MPVVVELLLVDEDPSAGDGGHLATGKGIYADLARQLQDSNSHLRRKSAFGALVARGASVHFVNEEQTILPKAQAIASDATAPPTTAALATAAEESEMGTDLASGSAWGATREPSAASTDSARQGRAAQVAEAANTSIVLPQATHQVPPIPHFPTVPSKPLASVENWWRSVLLYDWWPSCTPEPCKALPGVPADPCKISVLENQLDHLCLPATSAQLEAAMHEAGLGGFPLSLPHAYAAFPKSAGSADGAFAPASATSTSLSSALQAASTAHFRKAGVEVDEDELTVIFAPQRSQKGGGAGSSRERTPSTASTMAPMSPQVAPLPPWVTYSRLIFPLAEVHAVKLWPKSDVAQCWNPDLRGADALKSFRGRDMQAPPGSPAGYGPPWPYIVQVSGVPRGAPEELVILLALPTLQLAKRLQEAALRRPRKTEPAADQRNVGSVRCELHIAASLQVGPGPSTNFAAVVRRGVCEACHVGAERVRICSIRDAARERGAAWAPSSTAPPSPDAASHVQQQESSRPFVEVPSESLPTQAEASQAAPAKPAVERVEQAPEELPMPSQDAAVEMTDADLQRQDPTSPERSVAEEPQADAPEAGENATSLNPEPPEGGYDALLVESAPPQQASSSDEKASPSRDLICLENESANATAGNADAG
mmetsp:Transcript_143921/g.264431  ORF Transcript_143921/g.264431 Transcript_143921/m.264431 type:complete len:655 (+) Transcript_143921:108-2072(+)